MARASNCYDTESFNRDIAAFLGDVKLAPKLWQFIRRQISLQLLSAHEVHIRDVGTLFFKFRPGRAGPTGEWTADRLIIKFRPSNALALKFAESQSRGRGKRVLEQLKKEPRKHNNLLPYRRVAVRKPNASEQLVINAGMKAQLRQAGSDNALAQPPIPSSSAGQEESTKDL